MEVLSRLQIKKSYETKSHFTVKIWKLGTLAKIAVMTLKFEQCGFNLQWWSSNSGTDKEGI